MNSVYPEPPEELVRPRLRHMAAYLGPGVIIASVTIGSGELVWASRSGAIFGYTMLWCFLYAGVFKAIQVYSAARHITLTGEHPMVAWGTLPGPRYWFPLLIALPAVAVMPIAFSAIPEILGEFIHRLSGLGVDGAAIGPWEHLEWWKNVWGTAVLTLCLALALGSSYQLLERASTVVLAAMVLCIGVAVLVFGPQLRALVTGLLVPRVSQYPAWVWSVPKYADEFRGRSPWLEVALYLGAVGGGAYDYIGYIGMMREKRWGLAGTRVAGREELASAVTQEHVAAGETVARAQAWLRAPLLDTGLSFAFVILVTLLFAVLGTQVLHPQHVLPDRNNLLSEQERFLTSLHGELQWLYRAGVFLALVGTVYGAFEVYRHTFAESFLALAPRWTTAARLKSIRSGVVAYCYLGGLLLMWLPKGLAGDIVGRMTFSTVISGPAACGLWCFAMLWVDHVRLPPALRMSGWLRLLLMIAGVAMTGLGVQTIVVYFRGSA